MVWWSENLLLGGDFLLCAHMVGRTEQEPALGSFLKRGVIPLMRALSTWPNHLIKAPPPDTITFWLGVQHMNLGETQACSPFHHWLDKCWTYMISFSSHSNSKRWELSPIYVQWNCAGSSNQSAAKPRPRVVQAFSTVLHWTLHTFCKLQTELPSSIFSRAGNWVPTLAWCFCSSKRGSSENVGLIPCGSDCKTNRHICTHAHIHR